MKAMTGAPMLTAEGNTKNQLSTLNGCYIPCLLNILGAVLFLRVGFSIGMMGFWGSLAIFALSELIAYITISSFSAIVTNGRMAGGGAYFMISRNLGPAFGGSSGIMFWFTYCLNVTFNTVAFTETFQETFMPEGSWWAQTDNWSQQAISSITLFLLFLIAFKGAGAFAKINLLIFIGLIVALSVTIGSLFFSQEHITLKPIDYTDIDGTTTSFIGHFAPWSLSRLRDNMAFSPVASDECAQAAMFGSGAIAGQPCNLKIVFSIIFPAVVGMMEGANLSGDLKDPSRSIPLGTIAAVSTAFVCYILLIIGQAGSVDRVGLQYDMNIMQHVTVGKGYFMVLGVATACLSTALGSMFGSARILQAIARDEIFPCLGFFKQGTKKGDEPRNAIVVTFFLAEAGILLGGLDDVAPILTNFFLLVYCLVNFACFLLVTSRVPNFRPTFRCYSWHISLTGSVLIMVVMFYLNWLYALVTFILQALLFAYLQRRFSGRSDWIDIRQAVLYRASRRALLTLQTQRKDPKYWRPSLLLLAPAGHPSNELCHLASFLNRLKDSGLFVIGEAVVGDAAERYRPGEKSSNLLYDELVKTVPGLEAFPQQAVAATGRLASLNLVLGAGLGSMTPDTVALALPQNAESSALADGADELEALLHDVLRSQKNLLLCANFGSSGNTGGNTIPRVDLWLLGDLSAALSGEDEEEKQLSEKTQVSLLLQLGALCQAQGLERNGTQPRLRLMHCISAGGTEHEAMLQQWLRWARLPRVESQVVTAKNLPSRLLDVEEGVSTNFEAVNAQMREHSSDASMIFVMLPVVPSDVKAAVSGSSLRCLPKLTEGLPPVVLAINGQGFPIITSKI